MRGIKLAAPSGDDVNGTLPPEDLVRLADAVPGRYRALILLAGMVGLRWSEAVGLTVGNVQFLSRTLRVCETIAEVEGKLSMEATKSKSSVRTLSIPRPCSTNSHDIWPPSVPVPAPATWSPPEREACRFGGPSPPAFQARCDKSRARSGLSFRGPRKVATSYMVDEGVHPRVIQHRLGHATARMSQELYAHVTDPADQDAAARLGAHFSNATGTQRARNGSDGRSATLSNEVPVRAVEVTGLEPATSTLRT